VLALLFAISTALAGRALAQERPAFYFGTDLSYVNEMEDCGAKYRVNGAERDPYEIFREAGANLVRIRIWHDADWTRYSNLDDVKRSIRRAHAQGMQVLLDFHYSDEWADGDKQYIPRAWENIETVEALAQALYRYTYDTLVALDRDGLMPEMVQVGNETNKEILGRRDWDWANRPIDWTRNAQLLNAGIRGVRDAGRASHIRPLVMLHVAQPENVESWFRDAWAAGVRDFDLIGVSYYRKWSTQGPEGLGQTINRLRFRYSHAQVILVETAYAWTHDQADQAANLLGRDTLLESYPATPEGQRRYMVDLTQLVIANGGAGVVYWEPAWVSTRCRTRWGQGSHWENATFFDFKRSNELLPAASFMRHAYAQPVSVTFSVRPPSSPPEGRLFFWGDFLGARDFLVHATPDAEGRYSVTVRLMPGQRIRYQFFERLPLGAGLIGGSVAVDGFAQGVVGNADTHFDH
jgi:arabinogalactan endo-1,4-beta-galactosidase